MATVETTQARPQAILRGIVAAFVCVLILWQVVVSNGANLEIAAKSPVDALTIDSHNAAAHDILALSALEAKRLDDAHSQAIAAISASPINQSALTIAAISGPRSKLGQLLGLSASLGWRDLSTQMVLAQQGIQQGNADLFAQRIDAYERQARDVNLIQPLLDRYIANANVQTAIVPRLVANPEWRSQYLTGLSGTEPELVAAREALLTRLSHTTAPADRGELRAFVVDLYALGLKADAYNVWRGFAATSAHRSELLYDGNFQHSVSDASSSPYEWTLRQTPDAYAVAEANDNGAQLHVHSEGTAQGPLATQSTRLSAGRYRFSIHASLFGSVPDVRPSDFVVSIRCDSNDELIESRDGIGGSLQPGDNGFTVTIPAGCDEQVVTLGAVPGAAGVSDDIWLAGARINRVN